MNTIVEQLLRSQYFYTGLRIALGLLGLALAVHHFAGLTIAVVAASGAICTSIADLTSPARHKPLELLTAWLVSSSVYLIILLIQHNPLILGLSILLLSFLISMSAVYGPKYAPVGFSGTFAIVIALGAPEAQDVFSTLFLPFICGGGLYVLYGTLTSRFLAYRTKQQLFAECTFELAKFMRIKSRFYEKDAPLEDLYMELVRQQAVIVAKQQNTRDFLFRDIRTVQDRRLAALFVMQIDFLEHILAGNTDYEILQQHYSGSDIMLFMRDLAYKSARCLDGMAFTALRGTPSPEVNFKAEIFAIEHDIDRLSYDRTQDLDALTMLIDAFDKIIKSTGLLQEIVRVQTSPTFDKDPALRVRLKQFTTSAKLHPGVIWDNMTFSSPYLRYALRATIAMGGGYLVAWSLDSFTAGTTTHSFWILMTISTVLRSNFSMTVRRRTDRIVGTAAGCALAALILNFSPPLALLVAIMFVAQVAINTFITLNYRFTAAAASIVALIQIYFLNPVGASIFSERILDTVIGAVLAYVCSFIFPSWEYRSIPQLIEVLVRASSRYASAVMHFHTVDEEEYRLARKGLLDAMAELSGAFDRMQQEPLAQRRAIGDIGRFITLNYLFGARMASVRVLLERLDEHPQAVSGITDQLDEIWQKMSCFFDHAQDVCSPFSVVPQEEAAHELEEALQQSDRLEERKKDLDYTDQHVIDLLHRQVDAALNLASYIQTYHLNLGK